MRIKTAEQYQTRYARRGIAMAPRTRRSDLHDDFNDGAVLRVRGRDSMGRVVYGWRVPIQPAPDHAARDASIDACFPPLASWEGGRAYHPGKETRTTPKGFNERVHDYRVQNGCTGLTPRQRRRAEHKWHRSGI